jgi:L-lactate utilization protein LutC
MAELCQCPKCDHGRDKDQALILVSGFFRGIQESGNLGLVSPAFAGEMVAMIAMVLLDD